MTGPDPFPDPLPGPLPDPLPDSDAADPYGWEAIHEATRRLVRTVDALADAAYAEPSALPGWSRGHVVAHLALNGEALAAVLRGLVAGDAPAMYPSQSARDRAIDQLGSAEPGRLRDGLLAGCTVFQSAWEHLTDDARSRTFRRTPDADPWPAAQVAVLRLTEVEVHHADLDAGYSAGHWPEPFLDATFNRVVRDRQDGPPMLLRTPDGDVPLGGGAPGDGAQGDGAPGDGVLHQRGPVVTGSRAALTWWLLGRGAGQGLTGDPALPTLSPWR